MLKTIARGLVIVAIATFSCSTFAVGPGLYLGLMTGPAQNKSDDVDVQTDFGTLTPATPNSKQWGSRVFVGYQINEYVGFESGLFYLSDIKYDTNGVPTCSSNKARFHMLDAVVKGILPFNIFEVYAKAGVAIVYSSLSGSLSPDLTDECGKNNKSTTFRPTGTIGASIDFSQSWVGDVSYNVIHVGGLVNQVSYLAIGLSYHFVDRFCGQFLCDD